jgi:hypothetical protein
MSNDESPSDADVRFSLLELDLPGELNVPAPRPVKTVAEPLPAQIAAATLPRQAPIAPPPRLVSTPAAVATPRREANPPLPLPVSAAIAPLPSPQQAASDSPRRNQAPTMRNQVAVLVAPVSAPIAVLPEPVISDLSWKRHLPPVKKVAIWVGGPLLILLIILCASGTSNSSVQPSMSPDNLQDIKEITEAKWQRKIDKERVEVGLKPKYGGVIVPATAPVATVMPSAAAAPVRVTTSPKVRQPTVARSAPTSDVQGTRKDYTNLMQGLDELEDLGY